ncbi:MAG TPA: hypothetical protein VFX58_08210 [Chitinophagaceae bacterium]|nr:hypothetical protein [Chitinophagaceae bacterium]
MAKARQFYKLLARELKHAVITLEKWRLPAGRLVNKIDPGVDERTYFGRGSLHFYRTKMEQSKKLIARS